MWKRKMSGLMVRLMKPFEDEGSAGGGGGADFDIAGAVDTIGTDLFGATEPDDNAPANGEAGAGDVKTPPTTTDPDPSKTTPIAPPAAGTPPPADGTNPPAKVLEAPKTWRPEAAATWATLPPTVQEEIVKREADMFKGIEGYKANATIGQTFAQIAAPYQQLFQRDNTDPAQLTHSLFQAHAQLSLGTPEQKLAKINEIASLYGIQMQSTDPDAAPYVDPQVKALQDQIAGLKSQISGQTQWQQQQQQRENERIRTELTAEVDKFAADPANVYFNELGDDIAHLLSTKAAKDLKEAYELAIYRNPVTRQKEIDRKASETAEALRKSEAEKADKARQAMGANVKSRAKQASGTAALGSMDDTLRAALAEMQAREK
jgi:hypothetical protein